MKLIEQFLETQEQIQAIRRDIHAHPELRYEENRTADIVAKNLQQWGIQVTRGLGKTGLVGSIRAGSSQRAIGLRADMDALPMHEYNQFAHRSQHEGKMHACGHDGHTAMLLSAAQHLAKTRNFDGTVHLIFQPAEEGGAGAKAMMDDGLFTQFPCDAVFGMHNWPGMKVGQFGVASGPMMASSNEFEIIITGKGAHAALPHNGFDPLMTAVQIAQSLQTILTRNKKPIDAAVLSITQIHAGDAYNVIPNEAVLRGTVRTFTVEMIDLIERRMRAICEHTAAAFECKMEIRFLRNYPPLVNTQVETEFAAKVMEGLVGVENVNWTEPTMGSEDFAFMLLEKPGTYVFIANGEGDHREIGHGAGPCMLHNPSYDFNDELLPLGASYWVALTEKWLAK